MLDGAEAKARELARWRNVAVTGKTKTRIRANFFSIARFFLLKSVAIKSTAVVLYDGVVLSILADAFDLDIIKLILIVVLREKAKRETNQ